MNAKTRIRALCDQVNEDQAAIRFAAQAFRMNAYSPKRQLYLRKCEDCTRKLLATLNELLELLSPTGESNFTLVRDLKDRMQNAEDALAALQTMR